jgi:hypothetical protein
MMHSSPSFTPRQPPPGGSAVSETNTNTEVMRIPQATLMTLKREMGLADKDLATLTMQEKVLFFSLLIFSVSKTVSQFERCQ